MFEYTIQLNDRIQDCRTCPFRHENLSYENINSNDELTGTINICRKNSYCILRNETITRNETVDTYKSLCPLAGKVKEIK